MSIKRLIAVLSKILSDRYGAEVEVRDETVREMQ